MVSRIAQWTLDVHDMLLMAEFWSKVLGYRIDKRADGSAMLYPFDNASRDVLTVWLQPTAAPKQRKNRNHPDLAVDTGDLDSEIQRLLALGARRADVGQTGEESFVVFADPEGNEFCLLHRAPRDG